MIILILAIVAAIAAGGKIYNKSESIGKAIGFVVLAWVVGAIAALFVFEMTGMESSRRMRLF